uniref:Uncharacterized protein n=1 Tax=Peronospora matthiolae TaxID=2874970 RepID=A0AAV1T290_9STRA
MYHIEQDVLTYVARLTHKGAHGEPQGPCGCEQVACCVLVSKSSSNSSVPIRVPASVNEHGDHASSAPCIRTSGASSTTGGG